MKRSLVLSLIVALGAPGLPLSAARAQGLQPPTMSYGYQPYNDRNPTGFSHPNNTGYGHYVSNPVVTGHRSRTLSYRRFRGY